MDIRYAMKPCPFCGKRVEVVEIEMSTGGIDRLRADCGCGAVIEFYGDEYIYSNFNERVRMGKDALEKWNTRTEKGESNEVI